MGGPRGLAAFLFFLGLSSQVSAAQEVFIVKGTNYNDGLFAEEGQGSNAHYKRLGGANKYGNYYYLYRGTEPGLSALPRETTLKEEKQPSELLLDQRVRMHHRREDGKRSMMKARTGGRV